MSIFSISFIVLTALAPGLAWLLFFLKEDIHPEPKRLIFYTFGTGILMSIPVILIQVFSQSLIASIGGGIIITVILFAFIEEIFKFFSAYLIVGRSSELDEPVDFMIYMIAAALGLATIENFFILSELVISGGIGVISEASNIIILRFVGATFLHALASGLVGYYWARGVIEKNKHYISLGIIFATLIHGVFNFLVLAFQNLDYLIYPSIFLIATSTLIFKDFEKVKKIKV